MYQLGKIITKQKESDSYTNAFNYLNKNNDYFRFCMYKKMCVQYFCKKQ